MDDPQYRSPIDDWPTDDDMAAPCWCGHPLGQHEYGAEIARCDHYECPCHLARHGFDFPAPWRDAATGETDMAKLKEAVRG